MEPIESELRPTGKIITDERSGVRVKTPECALYITLKPSGEELDVIKMLGPEHLVSHLESITGARVILKSELVEVYLPALPFDEKNSLSMSVIAGIAKSRARLLQAFLEPHMRTKGQ